VPGKEIEIRLCAYLSDTNTIRVVAHVDVVVAVVATFICNTSRTKRNKFVLLLQLAVASGIVVAAVTVLVVDAVAAHAQVAQMYLNVVWFLPVSLSVM